MIGKIESNNFVVDPAVIKASIERVTLAFKQFNEALQRINLKGLDMETNETWTKVLPDGRISIGRSILAAIGPVGKDETYTVRVNRPRLTITHHPNGSLSAMVDGRLRLPGSYAEKMNLRPGDHVKVSYDRKTNSLRVQAAGLEVRRLPSGVSGVRG